MTSPSRYFAGLFDSFFVNKCQSCGAELDSHAALCKVCLDKWAEAMFDLCPFCDKPARECTCISPGVMSLVFYNSPLHTDFVRKLIFSFKQSSDRISSLFFARELASALSRSFLLADTDIREFTVVFPPRAKSAVSRYGFDQCAVLARSVARLTGAEYDKVFTRSGDVIQKQLDAEERMENAIRSYNLRRSADVRGKRFILIDDVITTGATVGVCARLLLNAGASDVFIASVARTYPIKPYSLQPTDIFVKIQRNP